MDNYKDDLGIKVEGDYGVSSTSTSEELEEEEIDEEDQSLVFKLSKS
jgi:hypothetical protein